MDPEVVRRLERDVAGGDFDSAGHAADVRALRADWERRGKALREIAAQKLGEETWDDLFAVATGAVEAARAALEGGNP